MAQKKSTIPHRDRKDPHAREQQQVRRHEINTKRPKQVWVNGLWERIPA